MSGPARHIVVVEVYEGQAEYRWADPAEAVPTEGLGLPLAALAERLDARFTVLSWDEFYALEHSGSSFVSWMAVPATRPLDRAATGPRRPVGPVAEHLTRRAVPARDPDHGLPIRLAGLSAVSHALHAQSDPLLYLSVCLDRALRELARSDPFTAVVVPLWGGLGFIAQLARATRLPGHVEAPFAVVVTDASETRQSADQEGLWNRPAVTRRQDEALSLALADLTIAFGRRGEALARAGRLVDAAPAVRAPRHVPEAVLAAIERAAEAPPGTGPVELFMREPTTAAFGALRMLDAVKLLREQGVGLPGGLRCTGPPMVFAPMAPRGFEDYWGSRPFVRELVAAGDWRFGNERPGGAGVRPVRIFPHLFCPLPQVWSELGRGSHVLLSQAAAEGLAPDGAPGGAPMPGAPSGALESEAPERWAARLAETAALPAEALDEQRRALCRRIASGYRGAAFEASLDGLAAALGRLAAEMPARQRLGRCARALLDRKADLRTIDARDLPPLEEDGDGTLSVVVPCCEMGDLLRETVHSVWASERRPDELLVVDDGSYGEPTLAALADLEREARARSQPLRIVRQRNRGLAAARNAGLTAARGEFIVFLDGDDLIDPAYFGLAERVLRENRELGGVAAWSEIFSASGNAGYWNAPQAELPFQYTENCIFVPCMTRTAFLRRLGGYDTEQRYNYEDWELTCRILAAERPIVTVPAYLQRYRVRDTSLLRTMTPVQNQVMRERFLARHRDTVLRFGVEIAMLIENRLMLERARVSTGGALAVTDTGMPKALRRLGEAARSAAGRALRRLRSRPPGR